jgi:tRNA (cmo5U34)-methyltransferase
MASEVFDKYASQYDQSRRMLIPCFERFYQAAIDQLPFPTNQVIQTLDLGAGTGLLSAFLLTRYFHARVLMLDASAEMLNIAKKRLLAVGNQAKFLQADYRYQLPSGPFDAVISALSIHHLDEHEKMSLFQRLFVILKPGGIFINADQVLGETPEQDQYFRTYWLNQVRSSGILAEDLAAALERMKADKMSTLSWQLESLHQSGFTQVNCAFQELSFVVYSGRKLP